MISQPAFAAMVWSAVALLALVFGHLVRSLAGDSGVAEATGAEVDR